MYIRHSAIYFTEICLTHHYINLFLIHIIHAKCLHTVDTFHPILSFFSLSHITLSVPYVLSLVRFRLRKEPPNKCMILLF